MKPLAYFRSLAGKFFCHADTTGDMDEELASHIQFRADDLERSGIPRVEAERRARIREPDLRLRRRHVDVHASRLARQEQEHGGMPIDAYRVARRLPDGAREAPVLDRPAVDEQVLVPTRAEGHRTPGCESREPQRSGAGLELLEVPQSLAPEHLEDPGRPVHRCRRIERVAADLQLHGYDCPGVWFPSETWEAVAAER